ncbi:hypothetical protein [Streptomyces specialis]|nr:hypothetical protein [Streptomyces specialis]
MPEWSLMVLVPVGLLTAGAGVFALWARLGTGRPVEHHSSMPDTYQPPDG